MDTDDIRKISDASKPNAGRIYDYMIGGNHNFEIDRQMAKKFEKAAPFASKLAKLTRIFLRESIRRMSEAGYNQFLDFASALPTKDHIHMNVPEGTKVIYSDFDPITVRYGRKIIGENKLIRYETCDAATPEILLASDVIKELFGDNHKCVIGYNGVFWFLSNDQISHAMKVLYEWADEGSTLFLTDGDMDSFTDEFQTIIDLYKNMNQYIGTRSKKTLIELVKPWKLKEPGFIPVEDWIGLSPIIIEETIKTWGGGGLFGGFLEK